MMALGIIAAPTVGVFAASSHDNPTYARLTICGIRLGNSATIYDAKEKYFLVSTGDCDGASLTVVLSPDINRLGFGGMDTEAGRKELIAEANKTSLPHLRDGSGVNIGDSPRRVKQKNGTPTRVLRNSLEVTYIYAGKIWVRPEKSYETVFLDESSRAVQRGYRAEYFFRHNKLWAIRYTAFDEHGEE